MRCRAPLTFLAAVFACWQSGCASLSPSGPEQSGLDIRQGTPVPGPDNMYGLKPGKYGELLVSSLPSESASGGRHTTFAGRIVAMTEVEVVLADCIRLEEADSSSPHSPFERVPYLNRLFKHTGVECKSTTVAGEVRIPKSSILAATPISEKDWPAYRERPHFQRIGIDFDFEVPSNADALSS